nr:LCP family protein [Bacilli bacterium]
MKKNIWKIIYTIFSVLMVINNIYLLINIKGLNGIENTLRLVGSIIIVLITLLIVFLNIKISNIKKIAPKIILIILGIIVIGAVGFLNINFKIIYNSLNKVTTNYTTYSISLVTTKDSNITNIKDIGSKDIGVIDDHEIANGYIFAEAILKDKNMSNKLVEYNSYFKIIDDLIDGKIEFAFLPSNYIEAFSTVDGYEKISEKLKTIYEENKQEKEEISTKSINEPFTLLLMGVDGTGDGIANMTANGDSLILVTFNPNTFNVTMMSIPRDSYVPISCMGNKKNKITHSSWGGERCIINTIQNLTGVKIDYYAKINFNGVVKLVDILGGIDIDVEYSFCEQNSQRLWAEHTVWVAKGFQTIGGEQALAYARNRHPNPDMCGPEYSDYDSNDFIRGSHQQDIIKAIINKIKGVRDLNTLYGILDTISNNMETNMDINTILSFYNIAKDLATKFRDGAPIDELVNIEKLYLSGYGAMIYDYSQATESGSQLVLWDYVPYEGSIQDVSNAMKLNLGLSTNDVVKDFSYDAAEPYEKTIIGQRYYNESSIALLPDFTGMTKSEVQSYADARNIKLTIEYTSDGDGIPGTVIYQTPGAKMDLSEMTTTGGINVVIKEGSKAFDYTECLKETNKNNTKCKFKDFTGESYDDFIDWLSDFPAIKKNISYKIIDEKSDDYNQNKSGLIKSITVDGDNLTTLSIYEAKSSKIVVTYFAKKQEKPEEDTSTSNENNNSSESNDETSTESNNSTTDENKDSNNNTNGGN